MNDWLSSMIKTLWLCKLSYANTSTCISDFKNETIAYHSWWMHHENVLLHLITYYVFNYFNNLIITFDYIGDNIGLYEWMTMW